MKNKSREGAPPRYGTACIYIRIKWNIRCTAVEHKNSDFSIKYWLSDANIDFAYEMLWIARIQSIERIIWGLTTIEYSVLSLS